VEGCCKSRESQTQEMSMGFTKAGKTIAMSDTAAEKGGGVSKRLMFSGVRSDSCRQPPRA
jgi:hypothetical protein